MKGVKCLSKMKTAIALLCALMIILITPKSASAVDVVYRPGIAVAIKLAGPDDSEIQRKYYSDTTFYQTLNTNSSNYQYMRMFFNAFNPNNRDFSLSFLYGNYDNNANYVFSPLEVNVLGAFNINVTQAKLSSLDLDGRKLALISGQDELTLTELDNLIMVNVTGNLAIDYYGTSTDHIDLYVGLHNRPINVYRPMAVISEDNILNDEMNFRHWVQNYLENLDLSFDVTAIVDAQEDTTSAVEDTTDAVNNPEYIQQEKQDLEDAKDDAQDAADDAGADAENQGTTLLQAFSSFVTAITNASPSNCNIDMDLGNLDLGVVNFCQLSPPPIFQTIASLFMIFFCVPLSINTARKVISLFRSFQT